MGKRKIFLALSSNILFFSSSLIAIASAGLRGQDHAGNAPGSLPQQDYQNVVAFLLVQNNLVEPGTVVDTARLNSVTLKK